MPQDQTLPCSYWVVGFSGKMSVANPAVVRTALRAELERLQIEVGRSRGGLVAASSAAKGADLIFAETALGLQIPWVAHLPMPVDAFYNWEDFPTESGTATEPTSEQRSRRCLEQAVEVEICGPDPGGESAARERVFHHCTARTVEEADLMIFVWDKQRSGKIGGTEDAYDYARRACHRPCILIHPETGAVTREPAPHHPTRLEEDVASHSHGHVESDEKSDLLPSDPFMEVAHALPHREGSPDKFTRSPEHSAVRRLLGRLGASAEDFGTLTRARMRRAVLWHAGAMAFGALSLAYHAESFHWWLVGAEVLCVVFALRLIWLLHTKHPQVHLASHRLGAELCRSLDATWTFPGDILEIYRIPEPSAMRFLRSLLVPRFFDKELDGLIQEEHPPHELVRAFVARYRSARLADQLNYYRRKRQQARRELRNESLSLALSFAALLAVGIAALVSSMWSHSEIPWQGIVYVLPIILPVAASYYLAQVSIHESKRRVARYAEMIDMIRDASRRLRHVRHRDTLLRIVTQTERAMLSENFEWYYQTKHMVAA